MILRHQGLRGNILRRDLEEKFDLIVDANDTILERVVRTLLNTNTYIDIYSSFKLMELS
jgi:hypothetical protein